MSSAQIISDAPVVSRVDDYLAALVNEPQALRGQQLRGGGPVADFEKLLAERCGFPYCVATSNATTALMALALILNVRNRIVCFPKNHWEGSVSAFRLFGAKIKRCDPSRPFQCRDGSDKPPVAIIVGDSSHKIDHSPNSFLIEDSCRIPSLTVPSGNLSSADIQVLSFGPGKPLSLGEGGAALFRSKSLYQQFVRISQHPERTATEFSKLGSMPRLALNGRIHPVAALLGREALRETYA
jgi:dTDP-4-amino-4,6-dideoxygalactose transaminase